MSAHSVVPLGSVVDIEMGQAPEGATYNDEGVGLPLLAGAGDLGEFVPRAKRFTTKPGKIAQAGDIILCIRATIGNRNVADGTYCLGRGVAGLRAKERVDPRYVWHALGHLTPVLVSEGRGSTFLQVGRDAIAGLPFPLLPLPEQHRIAAILDEADALRRKRREALGLLDDLLRATFVEKFGDPLTNPRGWEVVRLEEATDIASGVTKGRNFDGRATVTVPYMRVANVQDGHIRLDDVKEVEVLPGDVARYRLEVGDVLLTEGGDPDKLGRGAVWYGAVDPCIHQNHIFRVRCDRRKVLPEYTSRILGSELGKRYFARAAKQTTGIASINMTQLRGAPLLLAPLALQREWDQFVEEHSRERARVDERGAEIDRLFSSLLHRAFTGAL